MISVADDWRMVRDLEIRHLLALRAVADEGTFARAAERLGFTQSAVSQQIAGLERLVGGAVFDRPGGPRPVTLTPLGDVLLRHAGDILQHLHALSEDLDRFRTGDVGRLDIGTFQSVSVELLPRIVGALLAEKPGLEIRLHEADDPVELADHVLRGEYDLSFITGTYDHSGLDVIDVGYDPFVAVQLAGADRADCFGTPIRVLDLANGPLIGQSDGACQLQIDRGLASAGLDVTYVYRSNDNSAVQAMVRAGMGTAVLPLLAVDMDDPRICVRSLDPPIPDRLISVIRPAGRASSPALDRFVELALEECPVIDRRRCQLVEVLPGMAPADARIAASASQ
jgi:DNA-binding transcriptional LysR family regulator